VISSQKKKKNQELVLAKEDSELAPRFTSVVCGPDECYFHILKIAIILVSLLEK
jgi:hypothetical protein